MRLAQGLRDDVIGRQRDALLADLSILEANYALVGFISEDV